MQIITLLPLLALLAAPLTDARDHGAAGRRNVARHARHVRAADNIVANVARKEQLAQENPRAVRKVKRGANGCRVKGAAFTPSSNATASAVPVTSSVASVAAAQSSAASVAAAQNYVAQVSPMIFTATCG